LVHHLFNSAPLAIDINWLESQKPLIDNILRNQLNVASVESVKASLRDRMRSEDGEIRLFTGSEQVTFFGNTAIVPIKGVITKQLDFFSFFFGGTSMDMLRNVIAVLNSMSAVKNVLLDVDSPGGSVSGLVLGAEALRDLRKTKNILAFSNDLNASAAFLLSSASDALFVSPSSRTGSMGTVAIIANSARMFEDAGIEIKVVRAGEHKIKPNRFEKFTKKDIRIVQAAVDKHFNDFVDSVAANRKITREASLAMANGLLHEGEMAIEAGFADGEGTIEDAIAGLRNSSTPVTMAGLADKWSSIFTDSTPKPKSKLPMSGEHTPNTEMDELRAELSELRAALEQSTSLIQSQSALIVENGFRQTDGENTSLVERLISDQKIKARFRASLPAFLNAVARVSADHASFTFTDDEGATQETSLIAFAREFIGSIDPMVATDTIVRKDGAKVITSDMSSKDIQAAAYELQKEHKERGRTLSNQEAVSLVVKGGQA